MASDVEVHTEQRCVTEFLHADEIAPIGIHRCLLNIYGDQTVDVTALKIELCEQHFPSNDTVVAVANQ